jgi:cytoskeletal protein RodZ
LSKSDKTQPGKSKPLAGGVLHDARGNAVWQWATETARHAVASTSQLLRRLDVSSLSLEDDAQARKAPTRSSPSKPSQTGPAATGKPAAPAPKTPAGFNPYDRPALPRAAAGKKKQSAAPVPRRRSWWRRLFQRR